MFKLVEKFISKQPLTVPQTRKSSAFNSDFTFFVDNVGQLKAANNFNIQKIITNYETIAPLNSAINLIGNAVGGLPIALEEKKEGAEQDKGTLITNHPVLDLLSSPNKEEQKTKESFLSQAAIWRMLEGDSYIEAPGPVDSEPKELFILKPQFVDIQTDQRGFPSTYLFQSNIFSKAFKKEIVSGRIFGKNGEGELLHCKNFNPRAASSDPTGMSEVLPLFFEINQYLEASNHNLSLLKNGARPSGALIAKGQGDSLGYLTDKQSSRLKDQLQECYQGSNNSGRPMVIEGGIEWEEMGLSPKDMDFFNLKREAEQQIYKGLGIPIQLKMDSGATFNNKAEARLELYENRVIPLAQELLSCLNSFLLPRYPDTANMQLVVNLDEVGALGLKRSARTESINGNASLTLNEKRAELGRDEVDGGNNIFTASGLAIAGESLNEG